MGEVYGIDYKETLRLVRSIRPAQDGRKEFTPVKGKSMYFGVLAHGLENPENHMPVSNESNWYVVIGTHPDGPSNLLYTHSQRGEPQYLPYPENRVSLVVGIDRRNYIHEGIVSIRPTEFYLFIGTNKLEPDEGGWIDYSRRERDPNTGANVPEILDFDALAKRYPEAVSNLGEALYDTLRPKTGGNLPSSYKNLLPEAIADEAMKKVSDGQKKTAFSIFFRRK